MITPDDNGYGRLKRWRERNRGLANLRQREYRRKKKSGGESSPVERFESVAGSTPADSAARPFETKKVGEFRMLVLPEEKLEEAEVKPTILRDDYGRILTERQWKTWQEMKRKAKEGGYERDEYSQ